MGSYDNSDKGMMASTSYDDGRRMNDHTKDNSRRRLKGRHYSDGCQFIRWSLKRMEGGRHEDSIMTSHITADEDDEDVPHS